MYIVIRTDIEQHGYYDNTSVLNKTMFFFDTLAKAQKFVEMNPNYDKIVQVDNYSMLELECNEDTSIFTLKNSDGNVLDEH